MPQKFQPARLRTKGDNMSESTGENISESLGDFVGIGTFVDFCSEVYEVWTKYQARIAQIESVGVFPDSD
jgi:hypothetical protein